MKMKTLSLLVATLVSGAVLCQQAQAIPVPITGEIDMAGSVLLNKTFLGMADTAVSFSSVTVGFSQTGSFGSVASGTSVSWSGFSWSPVFTPVSPLWSFVSGGLTYSFDLGSITIVDWNNSQLNLIGNGVLKISGGGYTPTPGNWAFGITKAGGGASSTMKFTFSNSQTVAAPEGGLTIALLGSALVGLGMLRRRLS